MRPTAAVAHLADASWIFLGVGLGLGTCFVLAQHLQHFASVDAASLLGSGVIALLVATVPPRRSATLP